MFERFSAEARAVVVGAKELAGELHHHYIGTEHLLLAMLDGNAGVADTVLHQAGVDRDRFRADIERLTGAPSKILSDEDAAALRTVGIDLDAVLARIEETFGPGALEQPAPAERRGLLGRKWGGGGSRFTRRAKKVLELALREAIHLGHNHLGTEHILLGLIREGEGLAAKILVESGVNLGDLRRHVLAAIGKAA